MLNKNRHLILWTFSDQDLEGFDITFKILVAEFNMVESFQRYRYLEIVIFAKIAFFLTPRNFFLTTSNFPKILLEIVIYMYNKLALWKFTGNRLISTDVFPRFSGIFNRFSIGFCRLFFYMVTQF